MADSFQLDLIKRSVNEWNLWRSQNRDVHVDLESADLLGIDLSGADLSNANLRRTNLREANLNSANLSNAKLYRSNLNRADLTNANLTDSDLYRVYFGHCNLSGADLSRADMQRSILVKTNLAGTILRNARVHGISIWNLRGSPADQEDLIITLDDESIVTVDNLPMAQFVYLLLSNEQIRSVIDTITSKVVLILGRFTAERKSVLDALRSELRKKDLSPILFDFEMPQDRDITETVTLLARMARFVIADLTDPKSIPQEIQAIAPDLLIPIQPIILEGQEPWSMFRDLRRKYHWVLEPYVYKNEEHLIKTLDDVLAVVEAKRSTLSTN